ncbi:MAG TPA: response regulator [Selenomonadales bacterium]|nr:response regulator [Selenomonadales bacterium]
MVPIRIANVTNRPFLILVADDDVFIRTYLRDILSQDGYRIIEASNGLETVSAYQRFQPDLILLDVVMPEPDGCSACAKIRELASGKQVPILMLTSKEDEATINHAFQVGADDYLTKKFNPAVLRGRIKRLLEAEQNRKMVEHLARLDRLNVIGEMAAGIGHEVRNPMTTVRGFLQFLGRKKDLASYKDHFDLMIEELDRANSIIKEFLSLAKDKAMDFKPISLSDLVSDILPMLQADALLHNCSIETNLADAPPVLIDRQSIRQLILNMIRNAIEAMPRGGSIKVRVRRTENKVMLHIEDSGMGIPSEFMDKLGTPFVTSKETGSGLGLAICYRIAQRHDAEISVVSERGKGTLFTVSFNLPDVAEQRTG